MNLLEVQSLSKTYGTGDIAVHALKAATFPCRKESLSQLRENPAPGKVHC